MPGPKAPDAQRNGPLPNPAFNGGLLPTPPESMLCNVYKPSRKRSRSSAGAKIINITHNNYGPVLKPKMVSNFTQTPFMETELTTAPMPDLLDLRRRVQGHLNRRDLSMQQTANKIKEYMTNNLTDPYDLNDLQDGIEMVVDVVNIRGRALENMLNNNHTIAHVIWTNYLHQTKIAIGKDTKITDLKETKDFIEKLHIDHVADMHIGV